MRDGTALATDVRLPRGKGPFPTVLVRTPYGRTEAAIRLSAGLNEAGVALVVQDMRGRFDSEGLDLVFTTDGDGDLRDGYDTLAWIVDQRWSNGKVGTFGDSAEGIVQYLTAATDPPGLAVMHAGVATPSLYDDAMFPGGMRLYALSHMWLEQQGSLHFEEELANHPTDDAFWEPTQMLPRAGNVRVPAVHTAGWFDTFRDGSIDAFLAFQHRGGDGAAGQQKLIVGPWTHQGLWGTEQGELTFPDNASDLPSGNVFDVMFNACLELDHPEIDAVPDDVPAVQYYVMGDVDDPDAPGNAWRAATDWPPPSATTRLYLAPGEGLQADAPPGSATSYVFDPDDPAPTVCGANLMIEGGPCDQRQVEGRPDVIVFDTAVLSEPLEITGQVLAHLFVDIDQPDADLVVKLTDVYPDGRSMWITEGALRLAKRAPHEGLLPLASGDVVEAVLDLGNTSIIVNTGHRVRLSVTSSSWPRYSVNRNTGLEYPAYAEGAGTPVAVRVHHGGDHASFVDLPGPLE